MIWVGWRQQRAETVIAGAMLVLLAAVAIPVGVHMASVYRHEGLSVCARTVEPGPCNVSVASFLSRFGAFGNLFTLSTIVPAVAALLFAAPFVLDLDNGTYRLFWTQSITRRRWVATKLALSLAGSVAVAVCLAALAMWSRAPLDHLNGRMSANTFDVEGLVPIAYALLVLGVAVALGALWRRTVAALLGAFVVYVVCRSFMDSWLQQRLLAPVTTTWLASGNGPNLNQALVIDQFISDGNGHRLAASVGPCAGPSPSGGFLTHTQHVCVHAHGPHAHMTAIYQPASRFWALQGIEFAILAGIGALLVLLAARLAQRRIA